MQGQFVWHAWNRGDATRILPNGGGSLLESDCVSCGACADTCPTGAIEDRPVPDHGMPEKWTRTTCPYCGTGCEMLVGTRGDRIVQVKPAIDAPVNKGHLCVKGRYAFDFNHSPDRVREPMIREGRDMAHGDMGARVQFRRKRLHGILDAHGPQSVGMLGSARGTNEENYVAQKFARVVLGTNNIDCCARVCHAPTAVAMKQMLGTGAATNSFDDIEHAAAFLICGCNPTEAHPVVGARIKQAVLGGAKLVVIDPRATELTHYADVHLALRPGTNVPLLNALAHVILDESLADRNALNERVSGYDEFREIHPPLDSRTGGRDLRRECRRHPRRGTDLCDKRSGDGLSRPGHDRTRARHRGRDGARQSRTTHRKLRQTRLRRESAARPEQRARLRAHGLRAGPSHRLHPDRSRAAMSSPPLGRPAARRSRAESDGDDRRRRPQRTQGAMGDRL